MPRDTDSPARILSTRAAQEGDGAARSLPRGGRPHRADALAVVAHHGCRSVALTARGSLPASGTRALPGESRPSGGACACGFRRGLSGRVSPATPRPVRTVPAHRPRASGGYGGLWSNLPLGSVAYGGIPCRDTRHGVPGSPTRRNRDGTACGSLGRPSRRAGDGIPCRPAGCPSSVTGRRRRAGSRRQPRRRPPQRPLPGASSCAARPRARLAPRSGREGARATGSRDGASSRGPAARPARNGPSTGPRGPWGPVLYSLSLGLG